MKRIWIDFISPTQPKFRFVSIALITLGALLLLSSSLLYKQTNEEKVAAIWQRERLIQNSPRSALESIARPETEASTNELKALDNIRRQLNTPWENLFEVLEGTVSSSVKIVSLTSSSSKKSITIKVSVPNIQSAINFTERLQASGQLSEVRLSHQETDLDSEENALQVTINASWDPKP